jgi:hypothetical protein
MSGSHDAITSAMRCRREPTVNAEAPVNIVGENTAAFFCYSHAGAKLKWRELRMKMGMPAAGSSPAAQQSSAQSWRDALAQKKGEGQKLRE